MPRTVGEFEGTPVVIGAGRFGPYIMHNKKYVSLPKTEDPMTVGLDTAIELIQQKRIQEEQRHIKKFDEDPSMEILNGRYGPYIARDGKNYRIPKNLHDKAKDLTYEECMKINWSTRLSLPVTLRERLTKGCRTCMTKGWLPHKSGMRHWLLIRLRAHR